MPRSVTVALDERTVASVVMGENGVQGLYLRSVKSALDSVVLELDRRALLELTLLLDMAVEATNRGAVLMGQMEYTLQDADGVLRARQAQAELPF